jgi:hypothetical protein
MATTVADASGEFGGYRNSPVLSFLQSIRQDTFREPALKPDTPH